MWSSGWGQNEAGSTGVPLLSLGRPQFPPLCRLGLSLFPAAALRGGGRVPPWLLLGIEGLKSPHVMQD